MENPLDSISNITLVPKNQNATWHTFGFHLNYLLIIIEWGNDDEFCEVGTLKVTYKHTHINNAYMYDQLELGTKKF